MSFLALSSQPILRIVRAISPWIVSRTAVICGSLIYSANRQVDIITVRISSSLVLILRLALLNFFLYRAARPRARCRVFFAWVFSEPSAVTVTPRNLNSPTTGIFASFITNSLSVPGGNPTGIIAHFLTFTAK